MNKSISKIVQPIGLLIIKP